MTEQKISFTYFVDEKKIDQVKTMAKEQIKEFALTLAMDYDLEVEDLWEFIPVKEETEDGAEPTRDN